MKYWLMLFLLVPLLGEAFAFKEIRSQYEWGYLLASGIEQNGITRSRPYCLSKFNYSEDCRSDQSSAAESCLNDYELSFRMWADFSRVHYTKNIDLRSLYFQRTTSQWTLKLGFQEVAWGETFGLYIADFINPRDLTDPFFNELSYVRIPVCMINLQYFREPWSFQVLATPIPMNNILPAKGDPFDVLPKILDDTRILRPALFQVDRYGQDIEYGGKISYLFDSGWDVAGFYYRHWNRFPVYRLLENSWKPILRRIHSFGGSFSKAFEKVVLRGDLVINAKTPWTVHQLGMVKRRNITQIILGTDYTSDSHLLLGFQYHWNRWQEGDLHSFSFRIIKDFGDNLQYHAESFLYKGINNQDVWIQPKLSWDINNSLTVSLRLDVFGGKIGKGTPSTGFIGPYRHKERLFLWLSYAF